jgi:hypothetical protein
MRQQGPAQRALSGVLVAGTHDFLEQYVLLTTMLVPWKSTSKSMILYEDFLKTLWAQDNYSAQKENSKRIERIKLITVLGGKISKSARSAKSAYLILRRYPA